MSTVDVNAKRPLGSTGLMVTPLCIGCAALGNMPETFAYAVPEERAVETLKVAFTSEINFVDTAAIYGYGESERRVGRALRELGGLPDGYVLSTKADRNHTDGDFSGEQIKRSIAGSLERLGLDRLQIVYLHDPEHAPFESLMAKGGAVEVLQGYVAQGVIGHLGVAGGPIDLLIRYVETGAFASVITHNRFTLLNRCATPLLDIAHARGVAVVNAAPYGSGMLVKGPDQYARYAYQDAPAGLIERTRRLDEVCRRHGVPLAAAALHLSLRDPRIVSTVVGVTRPERIAETLALAKTPVPEAIWPELEPFAEFKLDPEAERFH